MTQGVPWQLEKEHQLMVLAAGGCTAREAAIAMGPGYTRNMVIGKLRRLRLKLVDPDPEALRFTGGSGKPPAMTPAAIAARRRRKLDAKRRSEQKRRDLARAGSIRLPHQPTVFDELPDTPPIGLMALTPFTCRWPVGEERPQMYCGAPTDFSMPYCPCHTRESDRGGTRPVMGLAYVQNLE